ncbi:AEC family transporter [Rhodovulum sp. DZ06]|uniref:AEC family transporter n=1 Tax=Rhodovulum sp. DZ06 TaxID=3425126 RepID=UPI003D339E18
MFSAFLIVLPIFALIGAGWIAGRKGVLGAHGVSSLNAFVVWLALPAMLFLAVARADLEVLLDPGFAGAFTLSAMVCMAVGLGAALLRGRALADAALDGLNASYPNVGFMGFPLALGAFGPAALPPTTAAALITMCVIFAVAVTLVEVGLQARARPLAAAGKVAASLARNPMLAAPALGLLFALSGLPLPEPAARFLDLLGRAAGPCALVTIGLFLAQAKVGEPPSRAGTALTVALKLAVHPALAWALATWVFALPPLGVACAVVLAALPTGTGAFMLAEFHRRDPRPTSAAIILTTLGAVVTVPLALALTG